MKRKITELIDRLHFDEVAKLKEHLEQVQPGIKKFELKSEEPVHFDVFVVSNLRQNAAERVKREDFEAKLESCNIVD